MNPQAQQLNVVLKGSIIHSLLSQKGKEIFYPKEGILAQTAEADGTRYNATVGIGLEDTKEPLCLPSLSKKVDLDGKDVFPYSYSYGEKPLREKWLQEMKKHHPTLKKTTLPIVTSGLTHGLSMAGYLFMDEGDAIITPHLYWGNYNLIFRNGCGVQLDTFTTFTDGFNVAGLTEKLLSKGTKKIVLLNFPNNPTGYTVTKEEATAIVDAILKAADAGKKILVICDDAYAGLIYKEGILEGSLFAELAHLHENVLAIKIDGATKELYAWGLRVGFLTISHKGMTKDIAEALEAKCAGAVRGSVSNVSHLSQSLILKALETKSIEKERDEKYQLLRARFREVERVLLNEKYAECFTALPYNSGYFLCLKLKKGDAETIRKKLLRTYSTGVVATKGLIRIAYSSLPTKDIEQLFENLYNVIHK